MIAAYHTRTITLFLFMNAFNLYGMEKNSSGMHHRKHPVSSNNNNGASIEDIKKVADDYFTIGKKHFYERNYKMAHSYLIEAADRGHAKAMYNLGVLEEYGLNEKRTKDLNRALEWYQSAFDNGDEPAKKGIERVKNK